MDADWTHDHIYMALLQLKAHLKIIRNLGPRVFKRFGLLAFKSGFYKKKLKKFWLATSFYNGPILALAEWLRDTHTHPLKFCNLLISFLMITVLVDVFSPAIDGLKKSKTINSLTKFFSLPLSDKTRSHLQTKNPSPYSLLYTSKSVKPWRLRTFTNLLPSLLEIPTVSVKNWGLLWMIWRKPSL